MSAVHEHIAAAVSQVPGWSPVDQLFSLYMLAYTSTPVGGDLLELGSWCGRSAVALGMAARSSGVGQVHCVDLFPEQEDWYRNPDGSWSFKVQVQGETIASYHQQTVWAEPFERDIAPLYACHGGLYGRFRKTLRDNHLETEVSPFRGELRHFFRNHPQCRLRLAFLDGHHSYDAVCHDIDCVLPHLNVGGWLCFDDAFTSYQGVDQAIRQRILTSPDFSDGQQLTRKLFVARKVR